MPQEVFLAHSRAKPGNGEKISRSEVSLVHRPHGLDTASFNKLGQSNCSEPHFFGLKRQNDLLQGCLPFPRGKSKGVGK